MPNAVLPGSSGEERAVACAGSAEDGAGGEGVDGFGPVFLAVGRGMAYDAEDDVGGSHIGRGACEPGRDVEAGARAEVGVEVEAGNLSGEVRGVDVHEGGVAVVAFGQGGVGVAIVALDGAEQVFCAPVHAQVVGNGVRSPAVLVGLARAAEVTADGQEAVGAAVEFERVAVGVGQGDCGLSQAVIVFQHGVGAHGRRDEGHEGVVALEVDGCDGFAHGLVEVFGRASALVFVIGGETNDFGVGARLGDIVEVERVTRAFHTRRTVGAGVDADDRLGARRACRIAGTVCLALVEVAHEALASDVVRGSARACHGPVGDVEAFEFGVVFEHLEADVVVTGDVRQRALVARGGVEPVVLERIAERQGAVVVGVVARCTLLGRHVKLIGLEPVFAVIGAGHELFRNLPGVADDEFAARGKCGFHEVLLLGNL